jgi:hypothetical protein
VGSRMQMIGPCSQVASAASAASVISDCQDLLERGNLQDSLGHGPQIKNLVWGLLKCRFNTKRFVVSLKKLELCRRGMLARYLQKSCRKFL